MKLPDGPASDHVTSAASGDAGALLLPGSNASKRKVREPVAKPSASETSADFHRLSAEFDSDDQGQDLRRRRTGRESARSSAPGPSSLMGAESIDHNVEDAATGNSRSMLRRLPARVGSRFADSSAAPIHPRRRTNVADLLAEALELSE